MEYKTCTCFIIYHFSVCTLGSFERFFLVYCVLKPKIWRKIQTSTYMNDIPQCFPAKDPAASKSESPTRATVGAIVRGPIRDMTNPISPVIPSTICKVDATIIAPWTCSNKKTRLSLINSHLRWNVFLLT